MSWSNRTPGLLSRPALLSLQGESGVKAMATKRLQTPCDILVNHSTPSETGGVGEEHPVIIASCFCDVEPLASRGDNAPIGFENETLYHVYLPSTQRVPYSARIRVPGWLALWAPVQGVAPGILRVATGEFGNGHFYECIKAGTTGAEEPLWDTRKGSVTTDGSAAWKEGGDAFTLEVALHDGERSRDGLICVLAKVLK